jgi:sporulation protein YlmC with PRC-barrel domain
LFNKLYITLVDSEWRSFFTKLEREVKMRIELTQIMDLNVYTDKGDYIGKVEDIKIDTNDKQVTGLVIGDINHNIFDIKYRYVVVPYRFAKSIADIILVSSVVKTLIGRAKPKEEA